MLGRNLIFSHFIWGSLPDKRRPCLPCVDNPPKIFIFLHSSTMVNRLLSNLHAEIYQNIKSMKYF